MRRQKKNPARPYFVCHMLSTIDGRIHVKNWPGFTMAVIKKRYSKLVDQIKADAWIVGRTTMEEFSSSKKPKLLTPKTKIPKTDFAASFERRSFAVVIDPEGKCFWDSNHIEDAHVIEVLSERVSQSYLAHLREREVSYVFAGKKEIDLEVVAKKLRGIFGIKRARVEGGGRVNGSFLEAGLLDEMSHILLPVIDGSKETPSLFDTDRTQDHKLAASLKLEHVRKLRGGGFWFRYRVQN